MSVTVSRGYTFGATEQVTNNKLHTLVDSSTVTGFAEVELDIESTLNANSDARVPSQKAVKTYVDSKETEWADYSATSTIVGWSTFTVKQIYTKKIGKTVFVAVRLEGTSDATSVTFTLPYTSANPSPLFVSCAATKDAGTNTTCGGLVNMAAGSSSVTVYKDMALALWTNSGEKLVWANFFYESI